MRRCPAVFWSAVLGCILLLMPGCSKTAEKTKPGEMTINLAYSTNTSPALVYIALDEGFFGDQGLVINAKSFDFGKPALDSVFSGGSDLATCADTPVVFSALAGINIGIAATIATAGKTTALVANRSSGVESPRDLEGKTVGVALDTSGEYFLFELLSARDIDPSKVRILDMAPDAMLKALQSGMVAAAVVWNPYLATIQKTLAEQALVMYGDDIYTEHFFIAGSMDFMRSRPLAMKAFMRAIIMAENFVKQKPEEAIAIISKYTGSDVDMVRSLMDLYRFRVSLDQGMLLTLEIETRWAMKLPATTRQVTPNYLEHIYIDALNSAAPARVRLIR